MASQNQIPLGDNLFAPDGRITQSWAFYLREFAANLPPSGSGYVIDGSAGSYGQMTLFQGPDSAKGTAATGHIYVAIDTGKIYVAHGAAWVTQIPAFSGDITNPVNSTTLTLNTVNAAVGTWGDGNNVPRITVDGKGRITNVFTEPVATGGSSPAGGVGSVQFNGGVTFAASPNLLFNIGTSTLTLTNEQVNGQITFTNPVPTRTNLLPVQTGLAGQVLATNGTDVYWEAPGPYEFIWHYGDASPGPLMTIPAGKAVLSCQIIVLQAMNGTGAALSVGSAAGYTDIMNSTDNVPTSLSTWSVEPNTVFGVNTSIFLSIIPGAGATAGSGLISITVQQ